MGRKKDDEAQPQDESAAEAVSAADRAEIPLAEPAASGADAAGEPAGGQPPGEPAAPGDGAQPSADGDILLVADAVLKEEGDGEAQEPVHEGEQDSAAQGQRDPDGKAEAPDQGQPDAGIEQGDEPGVDDEISADDSDHDHPDLTDDDYSGFDVFQLAASCAAATRLFVQRGQTVSYEDMFTREEAVIMVEFVRANPAAPLLAMYKHLELVKRLQPATPNAEDMLALTVFHAAASAAIGYERALAADQPAPAPPAGAWPGERSFKRQEPAFTPSGFSPR